MSEPLRLGIAGLGTVGASVVRLVTRQADALAARCGRPIVVSAVSARDRLKPRGFDTAPFAWLDDPVALADHDAVDVVVELIGGAEGPANRLIRRALANGKPVVTANKALVAAHGIELARLAEASGVTLGYEAAVAGGIPIIRTLREALVGNSVARISGILNGTCNYILTRMERERLSFAECLAAAQALGYAEADPTFDIEGHDTAHKLAILTSLAFGTQVDVPSVYVEGISRIERADIEAADELGYRIKLLGVARRTASGIEQRVHPTMVRKSSAIARIDGVLNAVAVTADAVGELVLAGPGAGGEATASSVLADVVDVAREARFPVFGRPVEALDPYRQAQIEAHEGGYYVRLAIYDRPGAFASIAGRMAERGISLESIVQRRRAPNADAPATSEPHDSSQTAILITYATTEAEIRAALSAVQADGNITSEPRLIRIEPL